MFLEKCVLCMRFANVSQRDRLVFISMGSKSTFHYTCHQEININIHKSGMLRYRPTTCGEKQGKSYSSENKDNFRCLITIWSFGIARRGLKELSFVKTSNSNQEIFHFCL